MRNRKRIALIVGAALLSACGVVLAQLPPGAAPPPPASTIRVKHPAGDLETPPHLPATHSGVRKAAPPIDADEPPPSVSLPVLSPLSPPPPLASVPTQTPKPGQSPDMPRIPTIGATVPTGMPRAAQFDLEPEIKSKPEDMSIDQLIDVVEAIRAEKAELEKREQAALKTIRLKAEKLRERMTKVGADSPPNPPKVEDPMKERPWTERQNIPPKVEGPMKEKPWTEHLNIQPVELRK
ncbi:hypothetical protein [Zavarzinella formosa]|uniref:hypothetical protein n=1 Tax=Zavarzinella formosa TaxID=360055 RepID=UPI000496DBD0|nr:hypothetical protein [Zavarzinella formosa]